ncbi:MAG: hypothetical protein JWR69_4522 [Pedosphaera sp.]|nr:hypothetical protein [Pedosphaera sp.]
MNNPSPANANAIPKSGEHLLDAIRAIRARVGDGLNDDEFTRLLHQSDLPIESGFSFLSYCDRFVTLKVPRQQLSDWYPEKGWVVPAKEKLARTIAEKYGISLCEPPDTLDPWLGSPNPHHHLELSNQQETIIIVHPEYLKIRLFVATRPARTACTAQKPLILGPDLLQDLSTFYQG